MSTQLPKRKVGTLRPSQLIYTFGVGSIVDLPYISAMVMGLDDWQAVRCEEVSETRLLAAVRAELGTQVKALRHPPLDPDDDGTKINPFEESELIGVPVAPFPRWMLCPYCRLLAPVQSGLFELRANPYRPDQTRYVHVNCTKPGRVPNVVPARFLVACPRGHLDDFPWDTFVHRGAKGCKSRLRLYEMGATGEAADIFIKCEVCSATRSMTEAFGRGVTDVLPGCRGRRPHLRDFEPNGCTESVTPILLGASNSWFPVTLTVLSVPRATDRLGQLVEDNWAVLEKATSPEVLKAFRAIGELADFSQFTDEEVWMELEKQRAVDGTGDSPSDLKSPEWEVLSRPRPELATLNLRLRAAAPPKGFDDYFKQTVIAERLREVQALTAFARIESPGDFGESPEVPEDRLAPLSRAAPTWVPAAEIRGEGVFLQLDDHALAKWLAKAATKERAARFIAAHGGWRKSRRLQPADTGFPGMGYILLHSFAHVLMRQLSLECGYAAASIRERIYYRPKEQGEPMAGLLLYTAAPDSEGTLGGLVALGEPEVLGRHIQQALERARLCTSDPLCADHIPPVDGAVIHGAACHACLFAPETSCERGNRYLDRTVLVPTVECDDLAFFEITE